jgi:hypothetical protein
MKVSRGLMLAFLAVVAVVATGCASGGGGSGEVRLDRNVGSATLNDLRERANRVVRIHQFEIEREDDEGMYYLETRWRDRTLFDDERALGIQSAQSRVVVRGNPRSPTAQGQFYSVNIIVENRVSLGIGEWREQVLTDEFRGWANRIIEDLRRELDVGVRQFGS